MKSLTVNEDLILPAGDITLEDILLSDDSARRKLQKLSAGKTLKVKVCNSYFTITHAYFYSLAGGTNVSYFMYGISADKDEENNTIEYTFPAASVKEITTIK